MCSEGMVALVQSLKDARLAITLMDGRRNKFTLVPNTDAEQQGQHPTKYPTINLHQQSSSGTDPLRSDMNNGRCDSSSQATDGRYTSMYQTTHGNIEPTSPPCEVTEFPPQRAELCPGHGNFEVGGLGSGETGRPVTRPHQGTYRGGGMSWVDRGSVFSPQPSQPVDKFASSLRKYPPASPDRSSEILERLVTYSQAKNLSRVSKSPSPHRSPDSEANHNEERTRRARWDEKRVARMDEYPTRDGRTRKEEFERKNNNRSYDTTRSSKDVARTKDNGRVNEYNSYQFRSRDDFSQPSYQKKININLSNSVHTETRPIAMCSKEVSTVPRAVPLKKNVAVPQSPSVSTMGQPEGSVSNVPSTTKMDQNSEKVVSFKSVQTRSSSIELRTRKTLGLRKSKSEYDIKKQQFNEGIVDMISNLAIHSQDKDNVLNGNILKDMWVKLHRVLANVEKQNCREKALISLGKKIGKAPVFVPFSLDAVNYCNRMKSNKWPEVDLYRSALPPFRLASVEDRIEDVVKDWVNSLPFESHNFEKPDDMIKISDYLIRHLLKLITGKHKFNCDSLKRQIINVINLAPELNLKRNVIQILTDGLVSELRNVAPNIFKKQSKLKSSFIKPHMHPSEDDINEMVSNEMNQFIDTYNIELNIKDMNEIKSELSELLVNHIYGSGLIRDKVVKEGIITFLLDYKIENGPAKDLANTLLNQVKQRTLPSSKYGNRNFIVGFNTSMTTTTPDTSTSDNLKAYKTYLCEQIYEWLMDLQIEIPKLTAQNVRESVINDLAEEIVERKKYLEFNSSETNDENELEYLKYQVYKWISKIVGRDNINIVEHAADLMEKIRDIPLSNNVQKVEPKVEISNSVPNIRGIHNACNLNVYNSTISNLRPSILKTNVNNQEQNESCYTQKSPRNTIQSVNEEYEEYVKNWVHQIPIPATSPQEKELSEKLRAGLHNGIWKALTKLKFDPVTFNNTFYYQDLLDDEVDSLLDSLPKSSELDAKKHVLKAQFLEHTTNTNGQLMKLAESTSFKQNLIENVANHVPRSSYDDINDPIKLHEDLQILSIVEDYILLTNYDDDNKTKANAFRRKLLKHVEGFVEELKKTHGKELKDIDIGMYMNDIMEALHNVPLPSEDAIKEEADEIILGMEIEHWFNDLPLIPNDDYYEQLRRRRLRESLAKKIIDIEKKQGPCSAVNMIYSEIQKFLKGLPIKPNELPNIKYFADELTNRLKHKKRDQYKRRSVVFQEHLPQRFPMNKESPHSSRNQRKFANSLPNTSFQNQSNDNQKKFISLQTPTPYQDLQFHEEVPKIQRFYGDKSKSNSYIPSSPIQYHPTAISNPANNSSLTGGGMFYNPREMNTTLDSSHDYHGFERNPPLSSSMYSLPSNIYGNPQSPQHTDSRWLDHEEQYKYPKPSAVPYIPETSWVSLEQVPMPEDLRNQLQSVQPIQQPMTSFVYSDSQSIPLTNFAEQNPTQSSCCTKNNNTSLPQVIQEQISRINEAALGNFSNADRSANLTLGSNVSQRPAECSVRYPNNTDNLSNVHRNAIISLGNNVSQRPAECSVRNPNDFRNNKGNIDNNYSNSNRNANFSLGKNVSQRPAECSLRYPNNSRSGNGNKDNKIVHSASRTFDNSNRTRLSLHNNQHNIMQPNQVYNQSVNHKNYEIVDQTARSAYVGSPLVQIQQNLNNNMEESPRFTRPSLLSAQNISEIAGFDNINTSQPHLNIPVPTAPILNIPQLQTNVPQILGPQQMVDPEQNQVHPSGVSYGQPQGFSTPNQVTNRRSPPRIGKKKRDPPRFGPGQARRRLDIDDSDDSEDVLEDCPCFSRLKRRPCGDLDYPCFYPFSYPYPYYF